MTRTVYSLIWSSGSELRLSVSGFDWFNVTQITCPTGIAHGVSEEKAYWFPSEQTTGFYSLRLAILQQRANSAARAATAGAIFRYVERLPSRFKPENSHISFILRTVHGFKISCIPARRHRSDEQDGSIPLRLYS